MHQTIFFTGKNTGCTEAGNLAWPNAHSLHFPSTTPRWEHDTLIDRPYTGTATPTPAHNTRIIALLCLLLTAWTSFLFIESTRPPAALFGLIPHLEKAAHFCAFSILGLLACGLSLTSPPNPASQLLRCHYWL